MKFHFWLEINGQVIDLTVDQFKGYGVPIYAENIHPLAEEFVEDKREPIGTYMGYYYDNVLGIERFSKAMSSIISKLKHVGWEYV